MKFFLCPTFLIVFCLNLPAQQNLYSGGMHTQAQISEVKSSIKQRKQPFVDAYHQLLTYADSASSHEFQAMSDFSVPGYYVDAEGHRRNSRALQTDAFYAYASALAYRISGESKYADNAIRLLNAWSYKNQRYSDADGSLVMTYSGTALVIAADLMTEGSSWDEADKKQFNHWTTHVYKKACDEIRHRKNNWADWGRFGSILAAQLLHDPAEIEENIRLIKSDLADRIAEDGSMPHETRRGANGIWYTYFSLAPITAACWVAYNTTGENLFDYNQNGRSLKTALDYLYEYSIHPESWPWFEKPVRGTPKRWPGNLFEATGSIYNDTRYSEYSRPAQPLLYPVHHFAWTFPTLMKPSL